MFCYSYTANDFREEMYCGIIVVWGGTMFVSLVGNPCLQSYIPTNIYTSIYLIYIYKRNSYRQNYIPTNQDIIGYPVAATYQHKNVTILFITDGAFISALNIPWHYVKGEKYDNKTMKMNNLVKMSPKLAL